MELITFDTTDTLTQVFYKATGPEATYYMNEWLETPELWEDKTHSARRLRTCHRKVYCLGFVAFMLENQRAGFTNFVEGSTFRAREANRSDITITQAIKYFYDPFACGKVSLKNGLATFSGYVNEALAPVLGVYVDLGGHKFEDVCENHVVECQGLRSTVVSLINWVPTMFAKGIHWTVDTIVAAIKKHFDQILDKFCPTASLVCGWITTLWDRIKLWTEEAWKYLGSCYEAFSEVLHVGIAILAVTLALNVIEQVLLLVKVLQNPMGLGSIFCKSAMAAVLTLELATHNDYVPRFVQFVQYVTHNFAGAMASIFVTKFDTASSTKDEEELRTMQGGLNSTASELVNDYFVAKEKAAVRAAQEKKLQDLKEKAEQWDRQNINVEAQTAPITLLEIIAEGLKQFASGGLVGMGRTMNAITQINTGIKSIKELAGRIFQVLGDLIFHIFGLEATLLQDASVLLADDLAGWLEEINKVQEQFFLKAYCTQAEVCQMHHLRKRGNDMHRTMLTSGRKFSPPVMRVLADGLKLLDKLVQECSIKGAPMPRKIPFCIFFQGESRVGKTLLMNRFVTEMQKELGVPDDQVYSRNCVDEFWSGYRRQAVVVYDDFGAIQKVPGVEAEFIPLVSSAPLPLNMASLNEKGLFFDSQVIIASTNFLEPSPESQIRDKDAFRNRRHVLVQVDIDPEKQYDPADFTANQRYRLVEHAGMGNYRTVRVFTCFMDLQVYILNAWQAHTDEQEKNLLNKGDEMFDVQRPVRHLKDVIDVSRTLTGFIVPIVDEDQDEAKGNYEHFLTFEQGGKLRSFWWDPETTDIFERPTKHMSEESKKKELYRTAQMCLVIYEFLKLNAETNIIIKNNLSDLANVDMWDESFKYVGQIGKPAFNAMLVPEVMQLPKWQRIALCCVGSQFQRTKKTPFVKQLLLKLKEFLAKLYAQEFSEWPVAVKLIVGMSFASLAAIGVWKMCEMLKTALGGTGMITAAAYAFNPKCKVDAQSKKPNRYDVSTYMYRNVPVVEKPWVYAQMSLDQSHVMLMENVMAHLEFGLNRVQIVMVPGRRFIAYGHALKQIKYPIFAHISTGGRRYRISYDPSRLVEVPDSELCVYEHETIQDIASSSWDLFCWDSEAEIPKQFNGMFFSSEWQHQTQSYQNEYAAIDVCLDTRGITVGEGAYKRDVPTCLRYKARTVKGDCGSIIVVQVGKKLKVAGIHVGGDGMNGYACLLPSLKMSVQAQAAQMYFDTYPIEQECHRGISVIGKLKEPYYVSCPTKTSFEETPEEYHLGLPCEKEPSILSGKDPRIKEEHKGFCPYRSGIQKYANPMGHLNQDLLEEVANDMKETWFDCSSGETFPEVDLETAINGIDQVEYMECIPKSTSEGFPHVLHRKPGEKGKMRFLEGDGQKFKLREGTTVAENYKLLVETCAKQVPTLVAIECPKDEKLPLRKIYEEPKTRCFSILPMEYNLLVRQKFLHFVRFQMQRRDVLPSQVGINPYSLEWGRIARRLQEVGNDVLCCDYKSFDGLMTTQVMECLANVINDFMDGDSKLRAERKNLLLACCSRLSVVKGEVWRVEGGIPSGFPLTVVMNGLFNELLVRYCFKKIMREAGAPPIQCAGFQSYVRFVVYGDDNLISVSPIIKHIFNGKKLKEEMAAFGVTITDGKDKTSPYLEFRPLEQCDFLKRGFVKRTDLIWDAPEELSSLYTQLHYVNTKCQDMKEAYIGNLVNVLRELYMHDPKKASDLRRIAVRSLDWVDYRNIGTIENIKCFYEMQRAGYRLDETIDLLCDVNKLGAYVREEPCKEILHLTSNVAIADLRFHSLDKIPEDQFWITCQTNFFEFDESKRMQMKWTSGSGRGGLPTILWLKTTLANPKSDVRKKLNLMLSNGKKLIFAASGNVLQPAVLAAIFMIKEHPNMAIAGNGVLAKVMSNVSTLGYLHDKSLALF
ncbi:polyprotein [Papaya comovirus]|nr:polyprotein [Papaya comovirus]QHB15139.1 polyprotein [Papaya comovirus]